MSSTIKIKARGTNYSLPAPEYGYDTNIRLGRSVQKLSMGNGYGIWDNSVTNRICTCNWLLNATNTQTLLNVFKDADKGRGIDIELSLPASSGFYPGGPDKGDSGKFKIRVLDIISGQVKEEPYIYFDTRVKFVVKEFPTYSIPSMVSEGDLQIGIFKGFRFPSSWARSSVNYGINGQATVSGSAYTIDRGVNSDDYSTKFSMEQNHSNSATLINYLITTVQDNNVTITTKGNSYIFGRDNGASGSYECQWIDENINVRHIRYDEFIFDLNFYYI